MVAYEQTGLPALLVVCNASGETMTGLRDKELRAKIEHGRAIAQEEQGGLVKQPFVNYTLDEDKPENPKTEVITLRLNRYERKQLNAFKKVLQQSKDGTAVKQLMLIAGVVIQRDIIGKVLEIALNNKRKNKRTGIQDYEQM